MATAVLRKLERNAFCRLCAYVIDKEEEAVTWQTEAAGRANIILCRDCCKHLATLAESEVKNPCLGNTDPNTWAVLDSSLPFTIGLFLELEYSQEPIAQSHNSDGWESLYQFDGNTYRVTLFNDDKWTVEVLK